MKKRRERPLIERDEKEIQREMAEYLGMPKDAIRVTKAELSDGRQVAYIRAVWKREVSTWKRKKRSARP